MELIGPIEWPILTEVGPTFFDLYYTEYNGERYIVATIGDVSETPTLLRIESACVFGHILNGLRCDCGNQLDQALTRIAEHGKGILVYALDEDARGHGVKMHFELYIYRQHRGRTDEREIFDELDKPLDARDYDHVVNILKQFDIDAVRVMTNNPRRLDFLEQSDIELADRCPLETNITEFNRDLLLDEKEWMGYETTYRTDKEWVADLEDSSSDYLLVEGQSNVVSRGNIEDLPTSGTNEIPESGFLTLYHKVDLPKSVKGTIHEYVDETVSATEPLSISEGRE